MIALYIAVGGMLGAAARYAAGLRLGYSGKGFPRGTTVVNVSGSMLLGVIVANEQALSPQLYALLGIGFCGAFTTFSTFGYETVTLMMQKKRRLAGLYVAVTLILGLAGAAAGYYASRLIL
ncbi:fluoride efflux transporter CrcB [Paenibacillus sp. F411]|uniref:fluoride efflux transporter CrcB n=1 Tax=Paenibacillus sp. F411 TaxID=2820239 RepID=UPI001AAFAF87|nr:fluoride efflux transporter CrcB [Paenibacillus sp. F411]MBO2943402.1 fluoride efflux transporter CrcB [Paenibacillus sp. F411]